MAVDEFEFPEAEEAGEMETEEETSAASSGPQKEGEERELLGGGGLKKVLVKSGSGWETPETGDEVKGGLRLSCPWLAGFCVRQSRLGFRFDGVRCG